MNFYTIVSQGATVFCVTWLVWVVRWLFGNKLNPKWQSHLWWVVAPFVLIPAQILNGGALVSFNQWVQQLRVFLELGLHSAYSSPWAMGNPAPMAMPTSWTDWSYLLYYLWIFSSMLYFIVSYIGLCHRVSKAVPVQLSLVSQVAEFYNLPIPVKVLESHQAKTPFVVGMFRPKLVLPMGQSVEELVILHELIHLKRRDVFWGWVTTLLRCVHPLTWYFCNQMDNDRERACDQAVLERLEGESRRDYGRILLSMVNNRGVHCPGATAMANGAKAIKTRIGSIANFRNYPRGMELVSICMMVVLTVSLLGGQTTAQDTYGDLEGVPPVEFGDDVAGRAMAFGQMHRAKTPAAALDFYAQARYWEGRYPERNLAYLSAVTPASELETVYENWKQQPGSPYLEGPLFRGVGQGQDGEYLCQMIYWNDDLKGPEYRVTTVSFQEADGLWNVKTAEEFYGKSPNGDMDFLVELPGVTTWTGEVAGHKLEISPVDTFSVNGPYLTEPLAINWMEQSYGRTNPDPDSDFWSHFTKIQYKVTNLTQEESCLEALDISTSGDDHQYNMKKDLNPGESVLNVVGGGGVAHKNSVTWESIAPTTSVTATVTIDGRTSNVQLQS